MFGVLIKLPMWDGCGIDVGSLNLMLRCCKLAVRPWGLLWNWNCGMALKVIVLAFLLRVPAGGGRGNSGGHMGAY